MELYNNLVIRQLHLLLTFFYQVGSVSWNKIAKASKGLVHQSSSNLFWSKLLCSSRFQHRQFFYCCPVYCRRVHVFFVRSICLFKQDFGIWIRIKCTLTLMLVKTSLASVDFLKKNANHVRYKTENNDNYIYLCNACLFRRVSSLLVACNSIDVFSAFLVGLFLVGKLNGQILAHCVASNMGKFSAVEKISLETFNNALIFF